MVATSRSTRLPSPHRDFPLQPNRNPAPASTRQLIRTLPLIQAAACYHGSGKCNEVSISVTQHPSICFAPRAAFTCKVAILIATLCTRTHLSHYISRHVNQGDVNCDEPALGFIHISFQPGRMHAQQTLHQDVTFPSNHFKHFHDVSESICQAPIVITS